MLSRRRAAVAPSADHIVNGQLSAFKPHHLPSLVTQIKVDEVAVLDMGSFPEQRPNSRKKSPAKLIIILCLNIGNDPPGFTRSETCARLECWTDPYVARMSHLPVTGGSNTIAETLKEQYVSQLGDVSVKKGVEVHLDEFKELLVKFCRKSENEWVLLHYNGHGMPCATELGEIWVFDKDKTHYVPFNIAEIADLVDSPTFYVLDCNSAGSIIEYWCTMGFNSSRPHDMFVAACSAGSFLPLNPLLPADVLTSCLTTPLKMALERYANFSHRKQLLPCVTAEMICAIPGSLGDMSSPLGELNSILIAVMESVAWCTFTPSQFHRLFRQDPTTSVLFRNFLLADRILREVGCVPVSLPSVPAEAHLHHAWDLWESTLEGVICQLPDLLTSDLVLNRNYAYKPSSFFTNQLMAFEVWIKSGNLSEEPEELPSALLALSQPSYQLPALVLLVHYLDSGVNAGKRAILCGILPRISKLLKQEKLFLIVSVLWMQVVRADVVWSTSEFTGSRLEKYFIKLLQLNEKTTELCTIDNEKFISSGVDGDLSGDCASWRLPGKEGCKARTDGFGARDTMHAYYSIDGVDIHRLKAMACYVLCQLLKYGDKEQSICLWDEGLLNAAFSLLESSSAEVRSWACLTLAQLLSSLSHAKKVVSQACTTHLDLLTYLLQDKSPVVRSSCVTLLATLVGSPANEQCIRRAQMEKSLLIKLRGFLHDASMNVREELVFFGCRVLFHYGGLLPCIRSSDISNRYMEYMHYVGQNSPEWSLDALMLFTLYQDLDTVKVTSALSSLGNNLPPHSQRVANEAIRSMSRVVSAYSSHVVSDADRARAARNADIMQQLVLDMQERKMEPPSALVGTRTRLASTNSSPSDIPTFDSSPAGPTKGMDRVGPLQPCIQHQVLPSLLSGDQVICATFRALDTTLVIGTKKQHIYNISYESYKKQEHINSFGVRLAAPLHDILVINDLAEQAGLLLVNRHGGYSLLRGPWDNSQVPPTEVAAFSACPLHKTVLIKSAYRSYNANLFYGGPIGEGGCTEIHVLSLDEEQVVQRLSVPGDPAITSLVAHTTGRALLAGCSDGTVLYYDDRQQQGSLGAVSTLQCRSSAMVERHTMWASPIDVGGAALTIATASPTSVCLYDSRKSTVPVVEVDVTTLSRTQGGCSLASAPVHISAFAAGVHTGMLGLFLSDGTYTALNMKGRPLLGEPIGVKNTKGPLFAEGFAVHPLRPALTLGGEVFLIH
uniref:Raptor N-terminal CASPase-like domain-containing protein n=1 Tax=Trypanosoma vivax (strain Y486) TaxID=1055687 RepID=G0U9T1_TRYVY|nr:conserved hypothetical protein, fragment [Trypanosoma vivax Y486]